MELLKCVFSLFLMYSHPLAHYHPHIFHTPCLLGTIFFECQNVMFMTEDDYIIYLTRMKAKILIPVLVLLLVSLAHAKPIYDFKTSYITQLTDFNFKDQVTKIRQNTNYVTLVQFYKFNGNIHTIQTANHKPL